MSIIGNILNNMSEADREKLGKLSTKINTDGDHKLTIVEAYEITSEGGKHPRFYLKCEDGEGKTIDTSLFLKQTVDKDDKGVVRAGEYSVNGVKTYLDTEGAEYDNVVAIGQISNLCKIVGLDLATVGAQAVASTITFPSKGAMPITDYVALKGKQFIGVSSYIISADQQDPNRVWKNQELNMNALFTAEGLSLGEVQAGKTEGTALATAVEAAKKAAKIKFSDQNNKACIQELKVLTSVGTVPAVETTTPAAGQLEVKPF